MSKTFKTRFEKQERIVTKTNPEIRAQQQFKKETDINTIVSRYMKTGLLGDPAATRKPLFGDFSSLDYHEMRNQIADIDQNFAQLPARIRSRFGNDPYQLIRFLDKPDNLPEAVKLGLVPDPREPGDKTVQTDLETESKKVETGVKTPPAPSTP